MSFRTTFIAATFAIAAVPAAFAGPVSADGAPLTIDASVASQASREQVRSTAQTGTARHASQGLSSADGSQLTLPAAHSTEVTRAQVQAQTRETRLEQRAADALPVLGLNG